MQYTDKNTTDKTISVKATMYPTPDVSALVHNFRVQPGETVIDAYRKHHRKYIKFNPVFSLIENKLP